MTTRLSGFVVTLDQDLREDDVEAIVTALRMVRHVIDVTPVEASSDFHMAQERVRQEVRGRLFDGIDAAFRREA